jgi:hypothetical protein
LLGGCNRRGVHDCVAESGQLLNSEQVTKKILELILMPDLELPGVKNTENFVFI